MKLDAQALKITHNQNARFVEELRTKSNEMHQVKQNNENVYIKLIDKILRTSPNRNTSIFRRSLDQIRPRKHILEPLPSPAV